MFQTIKSLSQSSIYLKIFSGARNCLCFELLYDDPLLITAKSEHTHTDLFADGHVSLYLISGASSLQVSVKYFSKMLPSRLHIKLTTENFPYML